MPAIRSDGVPNQRSRTPMIVFETGNDTEQV